ncbi:MAG TPA: hypothetical protein VGJ34_08345 [Gaiellaceae bacterium]|jgi:hypothetical protein
MMGAPSLPELSELEEEVLRHIAGRPSARTSGAELIRAFEARRNPPAQWQGAVKRLRSLRLLSRRLWGGEYILTPAGAAWLGGEDEAGE